MFRGKINMFRGKTNMFRGKTSMFRGKTNMFRGIATLPRLNTCLLCLAQVPRLKTKPFYMKLVNCFIEALLASKSVYGLQQINKLSLRIETAVKCTNI